MLECKSPSFVYYKPFRTGTRSTWKTLDDEFDCYDNRPHHQLFWIPQVSEPGTCLFMTVRNPYRRAVSMWHAFGPVMLGRHDENMLFPEFLEKYPDHKYAKIVQTIEDTAEFEVEDFEVVHQENLQRELNQLPVFKGHPLVLPRHNVSNYRDRPWWVPYEDHPDTVAFVLETYGKDFEPFGYSQNLNDAVEAS